MKIEKKNYFDRHKKGIYNYQGNSIGTISWKCLGKLASRRPITIWKNLFQVSLIFTARNRYVDRKSDWINYIGITQPRGPVCARTSRLQQWRAGSKIIVCQKVMVNNIVLY